MDRFKMIPVLEAEFDDDTSVDGEEDTEEEVDSRGDGDNIRQTGETQ